MVNFEPYQGFRLPNKGRSVLLRGLSTANGLSSKQAMAMAVDLQILFSELSGLPAVAFGKPLLVEASQFAVADGLSFKVVTPAVEGFLREGRFRLGNPTYYANLGDDPGKDGWEGYSALCAHWEKRSLIAMVTTGYNCVAFCVTRARDRSRIAQIRNKFGGESERVVTITDTRAFAEILSKNIPNNKIHVRDVIYTGSKIISKNFANYADTDRIFVPGQDLDDKVMDIIDRDLAPEIYRDALMASLFTKPRSFSSEQERRILFELDEDVPEPYYIDVTAPEALRYLHFED